MSKNHTNRKGLKAAGANANDVTEPHINLGDSLDESTKQALRQNFRLICSYVEDPDSDCDKWHERIMVVLLAAALEGRNVDVLVKVTGYPRAFIEHVWKRAAQTRVELNPLNWIDDEGRSAMRVWIYAGIIEGKCKLTRHRDGTFSLFDASDRYDFVPHDFVAAFQTGHTLQAYSGGKYDRTKARSPKQK
jgi:hypothetical protein